MKTSNNTQQRLIKRAGALAALLCALHAPLLAQTWNSGAGTQDWFTGGNWSGGAVPAGAAAVIINSGADSGPVLTSGSALATTLNVGSGASATGMLVLSGNASLVGTGLAWSGTGANSSGYISLSGSAFWQALGLYMGAGNNGVGRLDMTDDAVVTFTAFPSLGRTSGGQGYITMSGNAIINYTNSFFIGDAANTFGSIVMSGHSQINGSGSGDMLIGRTPGSTGIITMTDWATIITTRSLMVGGTSSGTLIMSGNSNFIIPATGYVGNDPGSSGVMLVSGAATVTATTSFVVGNSGTGVLTLQDNATLRTPGFSIGSVATGNGTLIITGTKGATIASLDGASPITITGGAGAAVVVFDHTDSDYLFAGNLTGSLSVTQSGAGYTEFTGTNDYTGGTIVSGGTLAGNTDNLQGSITNNATVLFNQAAGVSGTFSGVMSGNGVLAKAGAGELDLGNGLTAFNGSLMISGGVLRLNDTIAAGLKSVRMAGGVYDGNWTATGADRLLAGSGTITGNVSLTNATLGVGGNPASMGALTIGGNLSVNNSTLAFGCGANNQSDSINLLGALTATGSNTIDVAPQSSGMNTYNLGNIGQLANATLTINGVAADNSTGSVRQSASLSANGNDLILTLNSDISRALAWTGAASAQWNATASNWNGSANTTQYCPGDTVLFDSAADSAHTDNRTISIDAGTRNVSDMLVSGNASYTFTGPGGISALANYAAIDSANPDSLVNPAGKLLKSGAGVLAFQNTGGNNFAGGIEIAGGAISFNRPDQLGTTNSAGGDAGILFSASGTLAASADNITITNKILINNGATATLDTQSNTVTYAGSFDPASAGAFVKRGDGTLAVTGTIAAQNMELAQGTLSLASTGAINAASGMIIDQNAILLGNGGAITTAGLSNRGAIKIGKAAGAAAHGAMTINGNYSGDGGTLSLDMAVNAARTAIDYDQLIIKGNATGSTPVSFQIAPDPDPLPSGVTLPKISTMIAVSGSTAPGAFTPSGDVEFGGFDYAWNPAASAWVMDTSGAAKAMVCVDAASILIGKASFDSLQQRLMFARSRDNDKPRKMEVWIGGMARDEKLQGSIYKDATANTSGAQAGVDWINMSRGRGFVFGLYCDYAKSDMDLSNSAASTSTDATGVGLYASYRLGIWYLDAMIRRAREHYDITPRIGSEFYTHGTSWGGSLASGVTLDLAHAWHIEPQAQLTFLKHRIDAAADNTGRLYQTNSALSLEGSASARLWRDFTYAQGARVLTPYARASWLYDFKSASTVTVSDAVFRNNLGGAVGMIDIGAQLALGRQWSINAAGALFTGAKTQGWAINGGVRYSW